MRADLNLLLELGKEKQTFLFHVPNIVNRLLFDHKQRCMNDEANPYYTDMIDQQALGFKFILEEFGPCARPRAAWYI